jgi:hypothetical protein
LAAELGGVVSFEGYDKLRRRDLLAISEDAQTRGTADIARAGGGGGRVGLRPCSSVPADRGDTLAQISRTARSEVGIMA